MATTTNKGLLILNTGDSVNTWGAGVGATVSINDGVFQVLDKNLGGLFTKSLAGVSTYTLLLAEYQCVIHTFTGLLTGNCTLTYPNVGSFYIIDNQTTGSFTVSISTGVGSNVTATQGATTFIKTDATYGPKLANSAAGPVFIASGASAAAGLVPSPGTTAGATRFLREDATFAVPVLYPFGPQGRLTLTSGTPVTTSDVTGATSIYYDAYNGGTLVPVYNGSAFTLQTITAGEMTLTLNNPNHVVANLYDAFFFLDPGDGVTPVIGSGPAWSSLTSRGSGAGTTQLQTLNGTNTNAVIITARNGGTTYSVAANKATYLGTFYTTGTGATSDSLTNRVLFNAYNAVRKPMVRKESTASWTYTSSGTIRQANGSTSNQVNAVIGVPGHCPSVKVYCPASLTANTGAFVGIGINSTTVNSADAFGWSFTATGAVPGIATYDEYPGIGYYSFVWLEAVFNGGTGTFYGTLSNNSSTTQASITGTIIV